MTLRGEFVEALSSDNLRPGWMQGHVSIQLYGPKERKPVEAWRRGPFAVHEIVGIRSARLTHAPTGLRINDFASMEDAAECAERIEPLTDWSAISKKLETGSDLFPKVDAIVKEIRERVRIPVGQQRSGS